MNVTAFTWLWLWCLTSLSTICQLSRGDQFYWWGKLQTYHTSLANCITCCIEYTSPLAEFATLVVLYIDYANSYKFNYHRITTTCCNSFKVVIVLIIDKTRCIIKKTIILHHSGAARFTPAPVAIFIVVCDVFICCFCFHSLSCTQ